ncbi:MAG: flavin reductase family protein [gamma proteobacterium symbiont of Taylorina sp.]|nr:flavin reductase family protein [gamma proteobacterium symbiont of Taylorina sp.]
MAAQKNMNSELLKNYRNTIGLFATGVTVLIIEHQGEVRCMTANAVSSLSLEPVQLLVCPSKNAAFSEFVQQGAQFTVNILGIHQEQLSNYYAGMKTDVDDEPLHYEHLFSPSITAPRLKDCIASFACQITKQYDGGDHWIVVGEVLELYSNEINHKPLLFFGGKYHYPPKNEVELIKPTADPYQ